MSNNEMRYGIHAVLSLLKKNPHDVKHILILKDRRDKHIIEILKLAKQFNILLEEENRGTLDSLTEDGNHQGVIAYYKKSKSLQESDLENFIEHLTEPPLLLILDCIEDPHNLGACFRIADAFSVHAIIAPKDKAVGITPTVSKVASGAVETVPFFQVTNLSRTIEKLKTLGIWMYGADSEGKKLLYDADLKGPLAIVLGAEGKGLRRLTRDVCDYLISIPMTGTVGSLNVSVATGIVLYEVIRQRKK